ncbi:MAG: SGNH/GDSL hydrolase family protein [Roseinatronobacter sp.]
MWTQAASLLQLLHFAATVDRLPEAAGPRTGSGSGPRVLILGDSSAAGVGVEKQDQALAGQFVAALGGADWQLVARSGATAAQALRMRAQAGPCDVAITALGVNDVLHHTSAPRFRAGQVALLHALRAEHGARLVLASGVPPLGEFTTFPQPLRGHLGRRAARLDAVLQAVCRATGAVQGPFDLSPDPDWLARDGLHPSVKLYMEWGARMAGLVLRALS